MSVSPKECPRCGLWNPPGSRVCECGHDLRMASVATRTISVAATANGTCLVLDDIATGPLTPLLTSAVVQVSQHDKGKSFYNFVRTDPSALGFVCLIILLFALPSIGFAFSAKAFWGNDKGS